MVEQKIEYKKCIKIVEVLNNYFKNNVNLADIEYPSNIKYKTNKYYIYMFYSCLLDYGMRSKIYHKNLVETYNNYPNIFEPNYVINMDKEILKDIVVNNIHPRYPNVAVKKWINLSDSLMKYNDVLGYLKNINSFKELELFVKNINGFGQKTGGLLIRIICDSNICNFAENIESIPIDRHDIEISYLTGIINDKKIGKKEIGDLSDIFVKAGRYLEVNPSDIDKYLWQIGNSFCNKKMCNECPLNNFCKEKK